MTPAIIRIDLAEFAARLAKPTILKPPGRPKKRRLVDPTTCERDYTRDEVEFMCAMDRYRRQNNRNFPTWSEALGVLRTLGYEKRGGWSK